ncbi:FAD-binding protein [Escherichia coli]
MIYEKLLGLGLISHKNRYRLCLLHIIPCGGVMVDDRGRTDVEGLYAIGEVSYTGFTRR